MKYFPLIWAGLWRKRVRTTLTFLCVVVAFLLFGVLHGVTAAIEDIIGAMSDTRLRIMSRVNISEALPLAHMARIESVSGVEAVGFYNFFAGYYQDPTNGVDSGAIDVERLNATIPEIELSKEHIEAMRRTRNGALVGRDLAPSAAGRSAIVFRCNPRSGPARTARASGCSRSWASTARAPVRSRLPSFG